MRKINDFKNDAWKVLNDVENAKNGANILKTYFFGFSLFFAIFGFFENLSKRWLKIG